MMMIIPRFAVRDHAPTIYDTRSERMVCECFDGPDVKAMDLARRLCAHMNGEPFINPAPRIFEDPPAGTNLADWRESVGDGAFGDRFGNVRNFTDGQGNRIG